MNILFISIVGAFEYHENSLQKDYRAGEIIKGSVNLSLKQERADSLLKSNFIGNITLFGLLKANKFVEGGDFECSSANCADEYVLGNAIREFNLENDKIIGLRIEGEEISSINDIEFSVNSDIANSCKTPLFIDVLADKEDVMTTSEYTNSSCSSNNYGCFNNNLNSGAYREATITQDEICENITLPAAPAYAVGAKVKKLKNNGNLKISLRELDYNKLGECKLPQSTQAEENLECVIKYNSIVESKLLVCISGDFSSNVEYRIKSESQNPRCGTDNSDFEIFARALEYGKAGTRVNDSELEDEIYNYINERYGKDDGIECKPYCVVPVKLSGLSQNINLNNVKLSFYDRNILFDAPAEFYEVSVKPATINAKGIEINLEPAEFTIPIGTKEDKFALYLNDNLIFRENIDIEESFDFNLNTRFAYLGLETRFEAVTSFNISSSKWNFGDGVIEEANGKSINHRYKEAKTFTIEVELKRKDGVIAIKKFNIIAGNAKESANKTIADYKIRLKDIDKEIKSFPLFLQEVIGEEIDIAELNKSLSDLEKSFKNASSDKDYIDIVSSLLDLNIPYRIVGGIEGILPIAIGFENIDVGYFESISGTDAADNDKLRELIIGWGEANYKTDVEFELISVFSDGAKEDILTRFKLKISPKERAEAGLLFIDYPFDSLIFSQDYGQKPVDEGGAAYVGIETKQDIEFAIKEKIEVAELGAYIAPVKGFVIDEKEICEFGDPKCEIPFPWKKLFFWLGIVVLGTLVLYIILQEWYKRRYERHLFKNSNDLYNLVNFIYNARVSGLSDNEIRKKLKGTGWTGERITYAFKKIDGKRTGMWEIPIFKIFENRRVRAELEKRQGKPIDARFIKQPNF